MSELETAEEQLKFAASRRVALLAERATLGERISHSRDVAEIGRLRARLGKVDDELTAVCATGQHWAAQIVDAEAARLLSKADEDAATVQKAQARLAEIEPQLAALTAERARLLAELSIGKWGQAGVDARIYHNRRAEAVEKMLRDNNLLLEAAR